MKQQTKNWGLALCIAGLMSGTASCSPTKFVRGNILENYQVAAVQVGVDTPGDVMRKLGSPTTVAPFDDKIWYYMGQNTKKKGILDPKVTNERIVQVTFGENGTVSEIKDLDTHRADIPYVRDKTPTGGQEMNAAQQFIGNLGRFNKSAADNARKEQ